MAITMSYACAECTFRTSLLDAAQNHADKVGHVVDICGSITSRQPVIRRESIEAAARRKAEDAAILREARRRGVGPYAAQETGK